MTEARTLAMLLAVTTGCYGTTRYYAPQANEATRACVASCERGDDAEACLAHCPGITVEDESCPAPTPSSVCESHHHVRPGTTALVVVGLVVVLGVAALLIVASSGYGFIPN
jgi:hypothetical protein